MYIVYFVYKVGKVLVSDEQYFKTKIEAEYFAKAMVKQNIGKAQITKLKGVHE